MSEALPQKTDRERFEEELETLELSDEARRKLHEADDELVGVIMECRNQNSFLRAMLKINPSLTSAQFEEYQHVMELFRARVSKVNGVRRVVDESLSREAV